MTRENSHTPLEAGKWRVSGKGLGGPATLKASDRRNSPANSHSPADHRAGAAVDKLHACSQGFQSAFCAPLLLPRSSTSKESLYHGEDKRENRQLRDVETVQEKKLQTSLGTKDLTTVKQEELPEIKL